MENKTLKFASDLVPQILSGQKKTTWRLFDDKDIRDGDHLSLIDKSTNEEFAQADVLLVYEKKLGDIDEKDYDGHEKLLSHDEMLETYQRYYGDDVNDETPVKIIRFKLINNEE